MQTPRASRGRHVAKAAHAAVDDATESVPRAPDVGPHCCLAARTTEEVAHVPTHVNHSPG